MTEQEQHDFVNRAEALYANRLKGILEPQHLNEFVTIEPESGDYFLGKTLSDAAGAARKSHPNRFMYTMRVGHKAAIHFGGHSLNRAHVVAGLPTAPPFRPQVSSTNRPRDGKRRD